MPRAEDKNVIQPITTPQLKTWKSLPQGDVELMTEKEVLDFKPAPKVGDIRSE